MRQEVDVEAITARTQQLRRLETAMRDEWSLLSADIVAASADDLDTLTAEFAALEAEVTMLRMDEGAAHTRVDVSSDEDATTLV